MSRPFASLAPLRPLLNEINKDDTLVQPKKDGVHFFDLPQEVRDKIYSYLLDTRMVHFWIKPQQGPQYSNAETFTIYRTPWDFGTSALLVSQQFNQEASTVFYKSNQFLRVTLYAPIMRYAAIILQEIASNVTFHGTELQFTERCTRHAADVDISINQSMIKRSQIMIPYTSLGPLVTFLSTLCNARNAEHIPFSNIDIVVQNTYGLSQDVIQNNLLEPWRKIFNVPNVSLKWNSGPQDYVDRLQSDMKRKGFDAQAWLNATTNLQNNGNRAFENGNLEMSIDYFEQALSSIRIVYQNAPGSRREIVLALDEDFSKAVSRIRFECEMNISMAWVNLEDCFELARKHARNAIRISRDDSALDEVSDKPPNQAAWYTDAERATAFFCNGSAAMAQGAFETARDDFEEAHRLNPYDSGISRAAEQARRRLFEQ